MHIVCNFLWFNSFTYLFFINYLLQNQVYREITYTLKAVPFMGFLTAIVFLFEVKGYSKLYDNVHDSKYGMFNVDYCLKLLPKGWFYTKSV